MESIRFVSRTGSKLRHKDILDIDYVVRGRFMCSLVLKLLQIAGRSPGDPLLLGGAVLGDDPIHIASFRSLWLVLS